MIASIVYNKLLKNGLTITFAESMTGGLLSYELIKNPGSSKVIKGSIVAYSDAQKMNLLGIPEENIVSNCIVSKEIATQMAEHARLKIGASIGVGLTGNAGPSLQRGTSKQEVWISISDDQRNEAYYLDLQGLSRIQAIRKAVRFTYEKLAVFI
jgi:PncC family amidohydrolase